MKINIKWLIIRIVLFLACMGGTFAGGYVVGKAVGDDEATRQWESLYQETLFTHALTQAAHGRRIRQSLVSGDVDKAMRRTELGIDRALLDASAYAQAKQDWNLYFLATEWGDLKLERAGFTNKRTTAESQSINDVLDLVIRMEPPSGVP